MKKARVLAMILALVMVISLGACNGGGGGNGNGGSNLAGDRNGDGKITIAYSTIAYAISTLTMNMADNLQEACKERGWELNWLTAEGDYMLQGEQISQLVQMDPDYFLIFPADPMLAIDWVNEINAAGIPIVAMFVDVADEVKSKVAAYCGVDNYPMGRTIAEELIKDFGTQADINIVRIGGVPVQTDYIQRNAGFVEHIEANTNYTIMGDVGWAYSSRAEAQTIMENFITAYGEQINVLVGYDDELTLGGISALQAAGMTDVKVYSCVATLNSIQAMREGKLTMTTLCLTRETVDLALEVVDELMAGKTISNYYRYQNVPVIRIENVDQYTPEW